MPTARAAVFTGAGQPLEIRQFEVPDPQGSEILVRVTGCTLCGSDLHSYSGRRSVSVPTILGHEIIGTVAALGPQAPRQDAMGQALDLGSRVTWSLVASCGTCFYCRRSLPQKCEQMVKYGHEPIRPGKELTGGLAEYCLLAPGTTVLRVPDELADETACPANCATATVAAALAAAGELRDARVLILGAGMLGLTACAMARWLGATEVICCELSEPRLARAEAFGATRLARPIDVASVAQAATGGYGVDAAIELSGAPEALESALPLVRIGGTVVLVGAVFPTRAVSLLPEQVVRRNLTLRGVHNYRPEDLQTALRFLAEQRQYPFTSLVSQWLPLERADEAFRLAENREILRVGVRLPSCSPLPLRERGRG